MILDGWLHLSGLTLFYMGCFCEVDCSFVWARPGSFQNPNILTTTSGYILSSGCPPLPPPPVSVLALLPSPAEASHHPPFYLRRLSHRLPTFLPWDCFQWAAPENLSAGVTGAHEPIGISLLSEVHSTIVALERIMTMNPIS